MFKINNYLAFLVIGLLLFFAGGVTDVAAQEGAGEGFHYEPSGYVTVPNLNVRSGPSTNYPAFNVVHYGQTLALVGRNGASNWLQVRLGNGQVGWVMARYVSAAPDVIANLPITDNNPPPPPVEAIGYVTTGRLNVRSGPGLNQPIMGYLWRGEQIALIGRNSAGSWLQIRLPGPSKGWVAAQYVQSMVPIFSLPITEVGIPEPPPVYTGFVTIYNLNVRTGPGFNYPIVGRLNQGQQVTIFGRDVSGNWFKIGLPNGSQGWAAAQYIRIDIPVTQLKVL